MFLMDFLHGQWPQIWSKDSQILHDYNVLKHRALIELYYSTEPQVNTIKLSPYSPECDPCDICPFPKLKLPLLEKIFESLEMTKENATKELKVHALLGIQKVHG